MRVDEAIGKGLSLRIMEAIRIGFGLVGENMGLLIILLVFSVIWGLAIIPFMPPPNTANSPQLPSPTPILFVLLIVFMLINVFIQSGILGVLKDGVSTDGKVILGNFVGYGKKFYMRFLGMALFVILAAILAIGVLILLIGLISGLKNIVVTIVLSCIMAILAAIGACYLFLIFFAPYALVLEDAGIFKSMGNSIKFVRRNFGEIVGITTILLLINMIVALLMMSLNLISLVQPGIVYQVILSVIVGCLMTYIGLVSTTALLVYYVALSGVGQRKAELS